MDTPENAASRRSFIGQVAGLGAAAMLGESASISSATWNTSWIEKVRKAKHRAVFDAPMPGAVLDLATRYYDNIDAVYGKSAGRVCAVLNLRTRAVFIGIADSMWEKYAIGDDYKVVDPATGTSSRRNLDMRVPPDKAAQGYGSIENLQARGAVLLVCDFALGHLAGRLAKVAGANHDDVHAELQRNLVPGAVLVPSGIFGAAEAQNAGCSFIPS
jgi:hypothetical protein